MVARKKYPMSRPVVCVNCNKFYFWFIPDMVTGKRIPFCCDDCKKRYMQDVKDGKREKYKRTTLYKREVYNYFPDSDLKEMNPRMKVEDIAVGTIESQW